VARVAGLLNYAPRHWSTRDDMLAALARGLDRRGVRTTLAFAKNVPTEVGVRYQAAGADVRTIDTSIGIGPTWKALRALAPNEPIALAQIRFFNLHTVVPWLVRMAATEHVVVTDAEGGLHRAGSWKRHLVRLRARLLVRSASRIIAISGFVKERIEALGVPRDKVVVVHNAVDTARFHPDEATRARLRKELDIYPDELLLLTAGTLLPIKRMNTILGACATLAKRRLPFRLLVAGQGPLRAELETLAGELGLRERVQWLGEVADPVPLMQACDVFLLASVGEAFGNVLTEAMACASPVVATRSGGIPEVVEEGVTGRLAPPDDPAGLAAAVEEVVADPTRRLEMGARGRRRAETHFSLDDYVRRTLAVYDSVTADLSIPTR
jgi:glycosyltransferase involved in cell wall biosynthesis